MPKKFKGENTKAQDVRARKAAVKQDEAQRKQKAAEDEYWKDDDKHIARKNQRKAEMEQKKLEAANRKKEARELLESEMNSLPSKKAAEKPTNKVTRSEIQKQKETEVSKQKESTGGMKKNLSSQDNLVDENINQVIAAEATKDVVEARNVEDAISALGGDEKLDRHPERRQKAAFNKFELENMDRIKQENPNMRLSQWKQIIFKEWKKSPENPMNQASMAYNAKKE